MRAPAVGGTAVDEAEAAELARALGHPTRLRFLRALREHRDLSPSEFAREHGEPLGTVAHHVKVLFGAGVVKSTMRVSSGGPLEHRYSLTGARAGRAAAALDALVAQVEEPEVVQGGG